MVVAGHTGSADFPTAAPGSLGSSPLIPFVARLNASGTELVYATLFGSTNGNVSYAFDLTLDASSAPIVVGETNGADFPTTPGAYQPTFNEPSATINRGRDVFVTRFNASASDMVFSTFLGGRRFSIRITWGRSAEVTTALATSSWMPPTRSSSPVTRCRRISRLLRVRTIGPTPR